MKRLYNILLKLLNSIHGQSIVEYVVTFTVVVAVIIVAAVTLIQPALNNLYTETADSLDHINTTIP